MVKYTDKLEVEYTAKMGAHITQTALVFASTSAEYQKAQQMMTGTKMTLKATGRYRLSMQVMEYRARSYAKKERIIKKSYMLTFPYNLEKKPGCPAGYTYLHEEADKIIGDMDKCPIIVATLMCKSATHSAYYTNRSAYKYVPDKSLALDNTYPELGWLPRGEIVSNAADKAGSRMYYSIFGP